MIIEEWQILWVLGESAFCNDQYYMTQLQQNYFYISLIILSTHRFPLAGTSCWNVAHYQSHCFDLLYRPLLADFVPFFSCQKLLLKREEGRATYSSEHKISWQLWNSIRNHTHTHCNTTSRGKDGLLTVLVDFPAEVLLLWCVCRARQQEVGSWLGPGLLTVVVVVEEWVRAQRILVAVALVAVKARSWKQRMKYKRKEFVWLTI